MSELPAGWALVRLGEVLQGVEAGRSFRCIERPPTSNERGVIKVSAVSWGRFQEEESKTVPPDEAVDERARIKVGDLLFSRANTIELVGACVLVDKVNKQLYLSDKILRLNVALDIRRWIYRYLSSPQARKEMSEASSGNQLSMRNISQSALSQLSLPIAPEHEQVRIVDKLDSLLARVDACRERLDRVPGILKRFRQAVLAAATSGELTREWRGESKEHLPEQTPRTWSRCLIKEAGRVQLGRQRSPKYHSGSNMRPYLRVQNIFEDRIDLSDVMEMDFPGEDFERYKLHPGDILLNEGQSPEFLGRPALYNGELPGACFTNTLIRFQAHEFVSPDFALLVFRHYMHAGRFSSEGTITTNIAHLGAGRFGNIEFPLPSLAEQAEIVRRATILLSFADHCENEVKRGRSAADRLTPSLLSKAFRGELVPQDHSDEPASIALSRLHSGQHPPGKKIRRVTTQRELKVQISAKKGTAMLSRQDVSASHLSSILKERGPLGAEALWSASELDIDDFYEQLKDEEARGLLTEKRGDKAESVRMLEFVG